MPNSQCLPKRTIVHWPSARPSGRVPLSLIKVLLMPGDDAGWWSSDLVASFGSMPAASIALRSNDHPRFHDSTLEVALWWV